MKQRTPVIVNILIILVLLYIAFYLFTQDTVFITSYYFWGVAAISCIMAMIHSAIGDLIENKKFQALTETEKAEYLESKNIPYYKRLWDSAFKKQSSKEEKDILIDHGFDGIMELDNQLPKWWLGLFYFGVAFCILYMASYYTTDFAKPIKEYEAEYKAQIKSIEEYEATQPKITLETAKFSADNIAEGEQIFKTNCVSCHMDGGKGGIGPNLTDNFWKNQTEKTLFKNIFHVVDDGVTGTAMQAWGKNGVLPGKDIEKVAAYVYHINQDQAPITVDKGGAAPYGTEAKWEKE